MVAPESSPAATAAPSLTRLELAYICHEYRLGSLRQAPQLLAGGFMHDVWYIHTQTGEYVIKRLSRYPITPLQQLEESEKLARHFNDKGIAVATALLQESTHQPYVILEDMVFMVLPWVKGERITSISAQHALVIAQCLAKIHLSPPKEKLNFTAWPPLLVVDWHNLAASMQRHTSLTLPLEQLVSWQHVYEEGCYKLSKQCVMSHRDIYQSNVIWRHQQQPVLIDWEGAGYIHPHVELLGVAINWAGLPWGKFNLAIYRQIINCYQHSTSIQNCIGEEVVAVGLGSWLAWLHLNSQRLIGEVAANPLQQQRASKEIAITLQVLTFLTKSTAGLVTE